MSDPPRFVIGIDLGTTNSAVAFADLRELTASGLPRLRVFPVAQSVADAEVETRETLPSFVYVASEEERQTGALDLPWRAQPAWSVGTWAREHGALVPGRLVSSAKSWLCHPGVDRHARILPWGPEPGDRACSPVEASAAVLQHARDAWNHARAAGSGAESLRFERQAIVLTVPASFDEEARELTIEAARGAGFEHLTLIEEPTAALYAWIAANRPALGTRLAGGERLLVCDVGGGTTDFTLVDVTREDDELRFERTAVDEHLLLGGDNLDLALAAVVEEKLGRPRLTLRQQQSLRRLCSSAKERLLGPPPIARVPVSVLGAGRALVGGALATELTRDEVLRALQDGFLPDCPADAVVTADRRPGLRELGLPFAADPAITRHLASFLRAAGSGALVRPDVILFNGGFFTPEEARARVVDVVAGWFAPDAPGWRPRVLANAAPATAVAEGAAYYGLVRRGIGIRIGGGSPRTYFVGLRGPSEDGAGPVGAVCVLPRGTEEGTALALADRRFSVTSNRPLAFSLFSTLTRRDPLGALVTLDAETGDTEGVHRHAPLVTELRYGKRSRHVEVPVTLESRFTELGTLELWLAARETDHRWRLQFQLRGSGRAAASTDAELAEPDQPEALVEDAAVESSAAAVRAVFADAERGGAAASAETLMARLEETFGYGRQAWPLTLIRPLCDLLIELVEGRRRSARHEARWLNLFGFCLRPGFGATRDEARMTQARRLYLAGLVFEHDVQCQAEWLVVWQRLAGGLSAGQQQEIHQRHAGSLGVGAGRRPPRLNPQVEREGLRLLASLEHLPAATRTRLGEELLARVRRDPANASLVWALGRVGARVPFHGPVNTVVPPSVAARWAGQLLDVARPTDDVVATVVQMAARTGDPARDLDEDASVALHDRLAATGARPDAVRRVRDVEAVSRGEAQRAYGESLPEGLRLA